MKRCLSISFVVVFLVCITFLTESSAEIVSTFDVDADGWYATVAFGGAFTYESPGGNPGGYLRFNSNISPIGDSYYHAPSSFLGNWSSLGISQIKYDIIVFSTGSVYIIHNHWVSISGPGGSAYWTGPQPDPALGWRTIVVPIIESEDWTITEGTWNDIISNVDDFGISMAPYNNYGPFEITGIDNVILSDGGGGPCVGSSAEASTFETSPVHGASDLAYLLLPIGAVLGLGLWRRKK